MTLYEGLLILCLQTASKSPGWDDACISVAGGREPATKISYHIRNFWNHYCSFDVDLEDINELKAIIMQGICEMHTAFMRKRDIRKSEDAWEVIREEDERIRLLLEMMV